MIFGSVIGASILTVCGILNFIWTFPSVLTGRRIPGFVTMSSNPHCLWDPRFYLNISLCSYKLEDFWVCYLALPSSLSMGSWIFSELFSLFSQVGGFLGLLLGASILTVCEILDFIVMAVIAVWDQKKMRGRVTHVVEMVKDTNKY